MLQKCISLIPGRPPYFDYIAGQVPEVLAVDAGGGLYVLSLAYRIPSLGDSYT